LAEGHPCICAEAGRHRFQIAHKKSGLGLAKTA
jgi:hypothetical protein